MTMLRRISIASALAVAIACVPSHLAAAQKETPPQAKASAFGNLSSLWSELAAWFTSEVAPPPHTGSGATTDNGVIWDPWGG